MVGLGRAHAGGWRKLETIREAQVRSISIAKDGRRRLGVLVVGLHFIDLCAIHRIISGLQQEAPGALWEYIVNY